MDNVKEWTEVEFDSSMTFGTMRRTVNALLEEVQQELEKLTSIGKSSVQCCQDQVMTKTGVYTDRDETKTDLRVRNNFLIPEYNNYSTQLMLT